MSKAADRAWMKQYWESVGRERRNERRKEAVANETPEERASRLEQRRREYYARARAKAKNEQPPEKHHNPSVMVPLEMRRELEAEKMRKAIRLQMMQEGRWPLSALKASRLARMQRHSL